jgi:N-acetylneuraminic acid mutarotase
MAGGATAKAEGAAIVGGGATKAEGVATMVEGATMKAEGIAITGYKEHFPWVVKPWNIGGKIDKNQCFIHLYQLWKNKKYSGYFSICDKSCNNEIFQMFLIWENLIIP